MTKKLSRRDVLKGTTALAVGTAFAEPLRAAAHSGREAVIEAVADFD